MKKRLTYVSTGGYDAVFSEMIGDTEWLQRNNIMSETWNGNEIPAEEEVRVFDDARAAKGCELPYLCGMTPEEAEKAAIEWMSRVEDDSSWDWIVSRDEFHEICDDDESRIIAVIEKEL